jgi:hypothetical protein
MHTDDYRAKAADLRARAKRVQQPGLRLELPLLANEWDHLASCSSVHRHRRDADGGSSPAAPLN